MTGGVVLESASAHDLDQREMFYMYLSPGDIQSEKVCTITSNFVGVLLVFNIDTHMLVSFVLTSGILICRYSKRK